MRKIYAAIAFLMMFAGYGLPQASISPVPKLQFFDSSGKPLSGGKILTYASGTTTPTPTYTDATGLTPNPNPVILDAGGFASIWLGPSPYTFIVQTSAGIPLYSVDNISGLASSGGGGGGGSFNTLTGGINTGQALVVGAGSSITTAGGGAVAATSVDGPVGANTPNTGAFTTVTATTVNGSVNGSVGGTTPNTGTFTSVSTTGTNGGLTLPEGNGSLLTPASAVCDLWGNSSTHYLHVNCNNGAHSFDITNGGGATTGSVQFFSASGGLSPASATTYYVGPIGAGAKTIVGSQSGFSIPAACTLVGVTYYVNIAGTLDTATNHFTFSVDKNSGTALADTSNSTLVTNANIGQVTITTSDALAQGDLIRLKILTPTFTTPPTTVIFGASVLCQ